jgi:branched-chain amino acid transport system substrate-binding protein
MTRIPLLIAAFTTLFLVAACSGSDDEEDDTFTIGALLPLTGALSSYGETSRAALEEAVAAIGDSKVDLLIEDTRTDPPTALSKLQSFKDRGVEVVIGPYSSSEVQAVRTYADENGIILLSPLSTARTLSLPDDNVLRFTPDDEQEGVAVAVLARADGIRTIIAVTREDAGNQGLQAAFKPAFERLGGRVVPAVTYKPDETNFTDEARTIAEAINQQRDLGPIAVYLTAFNEVTALFGAVVDLNSPALNGIEWYGSDSVAQSKELVADAKAAAFAVSAVYPNPILGLRDEDKPKWEPVNQTIAQKIGRNPDAFALAAYDALTVAVQALEGRDPGSDAPALRGAIIRTANEYTGLTGPTRLNDAGDRALGNYDFWSVCKKGNGWDWFRSASYTVGTDGSGRTAHYPPNC